MQAPNSFLRPKGRVVMSSTYAPHIFSVQPQAGNHDSSVWGKIRSGVQSTILQFQEKASHPAFLELKRQRDQNNLLQPTFPQAIKDPEPVQDKNPEWTLVLSDTDNDIQTTLYTLWLTGLCDQDGNWQPGLQNLQVVHTGDWLNKWKPNHNTVAFFKQLKETAPTGCPVVLINGNHELSILHMADDGITSTLSAEDLEFICDQEILNISSDTLFIHGYPGLDLANILLQMRREELDLTRFATRLKEVFFAKNRPLYAERQGMEIIGDLKKPKIYYEKSTGKNSNNQGQETAKILQNLGIKTVIHGHKPHDHTQVDQELSTQLPGIRLVNNDNRIKQTGLGGLLLNRNGEIIFLNPNTMKAAGGEKAFRKTLKKQLKTRRKDLGLPSKKQQENKPNLELVA
jgi:UDP-2,3-diacylglucosamine pyrophosphatase LpxH